MSSLSNLELCVHDPGAPPQIEPNFCSSQKLELSFGDTEAASTSVRAEHILLQHFLLLKSIAANLCCLEMVSKTCRPENSTLRCTDLLARRSFQKIGVLEAFVD
jgi:hypothetical protein